MTTKKPRGRKGGRRGVPASTVAAIEALAQSGRSPTEICKALKVSRSTFYKYAAKEGAGKGGE